MYAKEEKMLLDFYEARAAEKRKALEQKKILAMQNSQSGLDSKPPTRRYSAVTVKNKEKEPSTTGSTSTNETKTEGKISQKNLNNHTDEETKFGNSSKKAFQSIEKPVDMIPDDTTKDVSEIQSTATIDITNKSYKKRKTTEQTEEEMDVELPITSAPVLNSTQLDPIEYPSERLLLTDDWSPHIAFKKEKTSKKYKLIDFGYDKNQTLVVKVTVPSSSPRWSLNIAPEDPVTTTSYDTDPSLVDSRVSDWTELLCHFNPRKGGKKSGLVLNDRTDGFWGTVDLRPPHDLPPLFGVTTEVMIQVLEEGFLIVIDGQLSALFEHRRDLVYINYLMLELPMADDYGNPEQVTFHQVWWGRKEPKHIEPADWDRIRFGSTTSLFIQGLPRVSDRDAARELEDMLWDLFSEYQPEKINFITNNKGWATMKVATPALANRAVKEMTDFEIQEAGGTDTFALKVDIEVSQH